MRRYPFYQVDAFTDRLFGGNPAAVCLLDRWPEDSLLQAIAAENNLSETAFVVPEGEIFALRWFTPVAEVDLCGHATLASAHVLFRERKHADTELTFQTRSGQLFVRRRESGYAMNFPLTPSYPVDVPPEALLKGLGFSPEAVYEGTDYLAIYPSEAHIRRLQPDFSLLRQLDRRGVIVTAPGEEVDFVSRFFAPKLGVPEDPVTGSAHTQLAPYWASHLGKRKLRAWQLSRRGGALVCEVTDYRVILIGQAVTYLRGEIEVPEL